MKRSTAYVTAAFLTASGLILGATATVLHLNLVPDALAQASVGGAAGTGTTTGTAQPGAQPGPGTQSTQPGGLNTTQPGSAAPSTGVNPYPGTATGATTQQPSVGANPALNTPRPGEVPPAPGTSVNRDGRPCSMSGTTAPNANMPTC